ncbi:hypothetical protein H671_3g9759 [Cricetulus griseus]|uniref:Uncharacterized protein n=1 Tax=Cricetulus griseus TaxID=10029 RepID=A0A061IEY8_CRIGR|nr:hypothetical protein H671_3g9759 [Cricetulus griseus]
MNLRRQPRYDGLQCHEAGIGLTATTSKDMELAGDFQVCSSPSAASISPVCCSISSSCSSLLTHELLRSAKQYSQA